MKILDRGLVGILALREQDVAKAMTFDEFFHIAKTLGAFWSYDYKAADSGKPGLHAELKSGLHSDGFFVSKILFEPENILRIMAGQMATQLMGTLRRTPDYVAGVPDGATNLGAMVAKMLGTEEAKMEKRDGKIVLLTSIGSGEILFVEDFCTRGTGFAEAVKYVRSHQPTAKIMPYDPVILNRGGFMSMSVDGVTERFRILSVIEKRINDWDPKVYCPLCAKGSKPIKPKATYENWHLITTSQL